MAASAYHYFYFGLPRSSRMHSVPLQSLFAGAMIGHRMPGTAAGFSDSQ
jgi:hypothetical protein